MNLAEEIKDPIAFHRVVNAIDRAIRASFNADGSRVTGAETKRRFEICLGIFRQLRGDLGWSTSRALDHLPRFLRCELDGAPWKPDTRSAWSPPTTR